MIRPLYHRVKCPQYQLDMRLGEPKGLSGHVGEDKIPIIVPAEN